MDYGLIDKIHHFLRETDFDAVLVSRLDSFLGEYYPPYHDRLKKITGGFSGSAGLVLISLDEAVLFVDSRYTEQAKIQSDSRFRVFEVPTETTPSQWIKDHFKEKIIGFNARTHSYAWVSYLRSFWSAEDIQLKPVSDAFWEDLFGQETFLQTDIFDYDLRYAGETSESKKERVALFLKDNNLDGFVISSPENISWLLNKRSQTTPEYPVIFQRGVIFKDGSFQFLSDLDYSVLKGLRIGMDLKQSPYDLYEKIAQNTVIQDQKDPIDLLKAVKNPIEIDNIKRATFSESRTICRFLAWIEQEKLTITEYDCTLKLKELRQEDPLYFADSFETIAASGPHASRAHYQADPENASLIRDYPLLLVDTGGHYLNGTTDMTRTICIKEPTELMKKRYTQVLKGHIALASARIKIGESTGVLDQKAHALLRADHVDYLHATGHGIGMMLAVHEMPPIIHEKDTEGLKAGMVFSNEPAYYSETDGFGIRLENMLLSVLDKDNEMRLENLLFIPFDPRLVCFDLLNEAEKTWLNLYHKEIINSIFPALEVKEQEVLKRLTDAFLIQ